MKYEVGDTVGVCGDGMYEFKLIGKNTKGTFIGECVKAHGNLSIKVGERRLIARKRIVVKL